MKEILRAMFSCVVYASFVFVAFSAEVVFNPIVANKDGSYSWTNEQNWVGGRLPGVNDVQVYQPDGELKVQIDSRPSGQYYQFAGMKFLSGKTIF